MALTIGMKPDNAKIRPQNIFAVEPKPLVVDMKPSSQEGKTRTVVITVTTERPEISEMLKNVSEQTRAILAAELEAGETLYGYREDGCYIARTRER